ncbi:unnamed protein product [Bathycoccus prasinos]
MIEDIEEVEMIPRPFLAWSMREKTCVVRRNGEDALEKVMPIFEMNEEEKNEASHIPSLISMLALYYSNNDRGLPCDKRGEESDDGYSCANNNCTDVADTRLRTESIKLKPKEHLYVNSSAFISVAFDNTATTNPFSLPLGTNSSFEITFVPTQTMRSANASSGYATIWTLEDSFENYTPSGGTTPSVDAREPCDAWPGVPPRFRVRYGPKYFMDGTENAAIIVETHVRCQQYAFVAPEEVMFRKNPVFENSYRWNSSSDSNESYLAVSLVVSFRGGEIDGSSESIFLSVDAFANGQPLRLATTRNVQFGQSYSFPRMNVLSKFIRLGDHCCFDGYVKYFAMYNTSLSTSNVQALHRGKLRKRVPETVLINTPVVFDVVAEDDNNEMRVIQVLAIDREEMYDTFKVEMITSPSIGRVGSCDENSPSFTYCAYATCTFCYYPPHKLLSAVTASTATFIEFLALHFDANVTEYPLSAIESARVRVTVNLLPPLLACVFREDAAKRDAQSCLTKTNTVVLNVTEDEETVVHVCVNDTRVHSSTLSSGNMRNANVNFIQFPTKGAAYWQESRKYAIEIDGRVFACSTFSYTPVNNYHGSDISTIRVASTSNENVTATFTKQIIFDVINIEDAKTLVAESADVFPVVEWMSRVDLSRSFTVSNAGVDSDMFLVRVSIVSDCQNLVYLTNDTALDASASLPLLRGDGGGDSNIEFEATPTVANALLESMEYLNVCNRYGDDLEYVNDTVTVRISSVTSSENLKPSETSIRLRVKPPSIDSYRLALTDAFQGDENKEVARARSKLYGILAASCLLALQLVSLQRLKSKSYEDDDDDDYYNHH